ncbi:MULTISPECIES: Fe-S biogenesis protein NfuA [Thalassolituus]|jgi:Fe/S biogenesis protein NfuA|uniref:Fe-S biogenesis protein NfuA n=1 Tax=Thalassolituus TaxID=187492 RepID=UPI0007D03137|nr:MULTISPECIES: Fe-S biogenesis protein NfuA [Thalassolituus]KZZ00182.1 Fe-S biogenesis protein NfuA [Oleibacter sp. HI0075]MAG43277.1 Fe/S biogenesis protein NfuA [Oceanospirillaceae bacterium]MEC9255599.1 Fe-S biogenesis protein NfuA [Pseudomonadota bacterium]HCG77873.1 Fe/S biogenesis protein NfuA [Oceanospirillales bacterium]MAX86549.1 Fe/S biogenesis protein NfuA [Oceanospirillaceae bacterium]|tara:strand:+ start:152 stop:742 length:591 start_codon:yes stop_codon:yes gene_type:complete
MTTYVEITPDAEEYLAGLLEKQTVEGMSVRIFITQPGTRYAETCLAYCRPDEVNPNDELQQMDKLNVYVEAMSIPYLEESKIDFAKDRMGGQLTIKAPNAKMPKVTEDSPVEERINYILYTEINPGLASHGGEVSLVELTEEGVAILKFGGGCQGCSAVDMTLKDGVEATLVAKVPEIQSVRDVTDHTQTENAYFK